MYDCRKLHDYIAVGCETVASFTPSSFDCLWHAETGHW